MNIYLLSKILIYIAAVIIGTCGAHAFIKKNWNDFVIFIILMIIIAILGPISIVLSYEIERKEK